MTGPLYAIGRFCSRHHYPVIGAWVVLAVALVLIGQAGGSKTSENLTLPGTGSTIATELLEDNLPEQAYGSNPLVLESKQGKLTEAKYADAVAETVKRLEAIPFVNSAVSPLSPEGAQFLSKDQTIGYIPVVLGIGPGEIDEEEAQRVLDAAEPAEAAGLETAVGSYVGQQLSKPSTETSEAIGLAAAVIILLFAFGTATAMMLPIVSAVIGLACALSIIRLLEHVLQVPGVASTLATMIGLGVGIDYALFIVTAVFQLGWGVELIGLDHAIPIVSFVPLLMFAILFGLSMDYEVFLLTQMREHFKQHGDERRAVTEGLANTGRVITSAAAIMVCVFTSFVLNGDPVVKEFGVGLAVAIAIDSTLVRCLLVPAVMVLLGKRAWWLPRWLERIVPHVSIEGEDYFARHDARTRGQAVKLNRRCSRSTCRMRSPCCAFWRCRSSSSPCWGRPPTATLSLPPSSPWRR